MMDLLAKGGLKLDDTTQDPVKEDIDDIDDAFADFDYFPTKKTSPKPPETRTLTKTTVSPTPPVATKVEEPKVASKTHLGTLPVASDLKHMPKAPSPVLTKAEVPKVTMKPHTSAQPKPEEPKVLPKTTVPPTVLTAEPKPVPKIPVPAQTKPSEPIVVSKPPSNPKTQPPEQEDSHDEFEDFDYVAPVKPPEQKLSNLNEKSAFIEVPKADSRKVSDLTASNASSKDNKDSRSGSNLLKTDSRDSTTATGKVRQAVLDSETIDIISSMQPFINSLLNKPPVPEPAIAKQDKPAAKQETKPPVKVEEEDTYDIDLDNIGGRERTTLTMSMNAFGGPAMKGPMLLDSDHIRLHDEKMVQNLVGHLKESQEEALKNMPKIRDLVAEIGVDISVSEDEEIPGSPLKSKKFKRNQTSSKETEAEDTSKLNSAFTSKFKREYDAIQSEYDKEIHLIKESTGKLNMDLDLIKEYSEADAISEIRLKELRGNFFEYSKTKYGEVRCLVCDQKGEFCAVSTKQAIFLWDKKLIENYSFISVGEDEYPTCLYFDRETDVLIAGLMNGDLAFYKLNRQERSLKKLHVAKFFSNTEILEVSACKGLSHLVAVDAEYRVLYANVDRNKPFEKSRIFSSQVGYTKRDVIPHIFIHYVRADLYLCCITAGVEVSFFEFRDPSKNKQAKPCTKTSSFEVDLEKFEQRQAPASPDAGAKDSASATVPGPQQGSTWEIRGDETDEEVRDLGMMKKKSFDKVEAYPLMFEYNDIRESLILVLAIYKGVFIYELKLGAADRQPEQTLLETIRIKRRPIKFTLFVAGYAILMDCLLNCYLVDLGTILKQKVGGVQIRKSFMEMQTKKFRAFISHSIADPDPQLLGETDGGEDYDKDFVFLVYAVNDPQTILRTITSVRKLLSYSCLVDVLDSGEIIFLTKKSLFLLEIMDWKTYLNECLENKKYYLILKVINEMLDGENTQLRKLPPVRDLQRELVYYIEHALQDFVVQLVLQPASEIELFTNYCMMTLYKNHMVDFLLNDLERLMEENQLAGYYIQNLIIFFRSHLIPNLDIDKIFKIITHLEYDPLEKQRFILYLFNRKMHRDMLFNNLANRGNMNLLCYLSDKVEEPAKAIFVLEYLRCSFEIACSEHAHGEQAGELRHGAFPQQTTKSLYNIFWYVHEFTKSSLEKSEVKLEDHCWYVLNWILNPEYIKLFVSHDFKAYLEGWALLLEKHFTLLLQLNFNVDFTRNYKPIENEIMCPVKSCKEMIFLFNHIYQLVKDDKKNLSYFYYFVSLLKFKKIPCIELNDLYLKKLVFGLISNISDIVSDSRITVDKDDVNILIFATFTEHKEIFVDNQELKALIMENQ